jgi:SHS family lactate transporter-like MFS transporter
LISSASSTIEARLGEDFPLPPKGKVKRYEYGIVICIFMGCVYAYLLIFTFLGPEHLCRQFDVEHDVDARALAASRKVEDVLEEMRLQPSMSHVDEENKVGDKKEKAQGEKS